MEYEAIIGMEVHAQVLTASKMFCSCPADSTPAEPNIYVCPVCLGMPGVLPVINQAAVEATILTGLALNCEIPSFSKFDRKNYTYPDLPKGYQISQYDFPLCVRGWLEIEVSGEIKRIRIRRVHLEEDTAKLVHEEGSSLIDYNRAGVPLMEIVSEADIRSAEEAWAYLTKLHTILRYIGVNTGNMEEGAMRCEANVSVRPVGSQEFGTKVEVKNLNSFRSVRLAIAYEVERQKRLLVNEERVEQVTMGWDEERHCTVFQRSKEYAEDYRYFPEPDLPPLEFTREQIDAIAARLPELPDAKERRFVEQYGLRPQDARLLTQDREIAAFFETTLESVNEQVSSQTVANWMVGEVFRLLREMASDILSLKTSPAQLAELINLVSVGAINATVAKEVLSEMVASGESASSVIARRGLGQIGNRDTLREIARQVIAENPKPLRQYLDGKETVFGFFIGQVMKATRGQADVHAVREILKDELGRRL